MLTRIISIVLIFSLIVAQEVTLSIGNFNDTGSSISFDVMMVNTEPVQGFQFDLSIGDGTFNDNNYCICTAASTELPAGCNECYYDFGVDKVRNAYEYDTNTSNSYSYGCEDFGLCTDESLSSGDCEDDGVCSNGSTSSSDCSAWGSCTNSNQIDQCSCEYGNGTWVPTNLVWTPDNSYLPFNNPESCLGATSPDGDPYIWDYFNPDGNKDNYIPLEYQFCHVPEFNGDFSENDNMHNSEDFSPGHCSQYEPICIAVGGSLTGPGTDHPIGTILDWSIECCNITQGGQVFYPYRNKELCQGSVEIWNTFYDIENEWTWTDYSDQSTCEMYGGTWDGSESGTEGNYAYDEGEFFIEGQTLESLTFSTPMDLMMNSFFVNGSGNRAIGISFTGYTIPASDTPTVIANVTGSYGGISSGSIYEIFSATICGAGNNCPSLMVFSDGASQELSSGFIPFVWEVGSGGTNATTNDGICTTMSGFGEDSQDDSACVGYCGDGYCIDGEDYSFCSSDCEPTCGDGVCSLYEAAETAENCPSDCSIFGCGDFICSEGETPSNCPYDCFYPFCGDGNCDVDENESNCLIDCQAILGCTDPNANNYNENANTDDGSCEYQDLGDINGDGLINILDILNLVNIILDGEYSYYADVNEDGLNNILDILGIVNMILG